MSGGVNVWGGERRDSKCCTIISMVAVVATIDNDCDDEECDIIIFHVYSESIGIRCIIIKTMNMNIRMMMMMVIHLHQQYWHHQRRASASTTGFSI